MIVSVTFRGVHLSERVSSVLMIKEADRTLSHSLLDLQNQDSQPMPSSKLY